MRPSGRAEVTIFTGSLGGVSKENGNTMLLYLQSSLDFVSPGALLGKKTILLLVFFLPQSDTTESFITSQTNKSYVSHILHFFGLLMNLSYVN